MTSSAPDMSDPRTTLDAIDKTVASGERYMQLVYDENEVTTADYYKIMAAVKKHVKTKGYYHTYDFWTDGSNYGGCDWLHMRIKTDTSERGGTCWRSDLWKFDDDDDAEESGHGGDEPAGGGSDD